MWPVTADATDEELMRRLAEGPPAALALRELIPIRTTSVGVLLVVVADSGFVH